MKARQLISGATYSPETLQVIGQAFDEAWATIAPNFGSDPQDIEKARLRLAHAVLAVATEHSRDVDVLKAGALATMAPGYREKMKD